VAVRQADHRGYALQSVDSGRLLLVAATAVLLVVAVAQTASSITNRDIAIAFGLFIAFGELLRLSLPGGRVAAPIAMSAALAYAMTDTVAAHGGYVLAPVLRVVAVSAVGMIVGALPHIAAGRPNGVTGMAARLLAVACVAGSYSFLLTHVLGRHQLIGNPRYALADLAVMAVLAAFGWLIETVIGGIIRADDLRARYIVTLSDELSVQWRLGHHRPRRGSDGNVGDRCLRGSVAHHPARLPPVRSHQGHLPPDSDGTCAGHRGRRLRRGGARRPGYHARPGDRTRPGDA
jgi:hypothetical protein